MKYMIHTYTARLWYVQGYLIPSMIEQGIKEEDIILWLDDKGWGNLTSWNKSCEYIRDNFPANEGMWHLQDDVLIARNFYEKTKNHDKRIIGVGFRNAIYNLSEAALVGKQRMYDLAYSFPCIFIPNNLMQGYLEFFQEEVVEGGKYKKMYERNRGDDYFFYLYLKAYKPTLDVYNYDPCLVEHICYLIGGSTLYVRKKEVRAYNFKDIDLIQRFEEDLNNGKKKKNKSKQV